MKCSKCQLHDLIYRCKLVSSTLNSFNLLTPIIHNPCNQSNCSCVSTLCNINSAHNQYIF